MKKENGISFVVPAYNADKWIGECICSIMQGNINLSLGDELIIVNDGSRDGTLDLITRLSSRYSGIKVIDNGGNIGCPASRNVGIREAKNPWIMNVDSDNILLPGSVKALRTYMAQTNADICHFGAIKFFLNSKENITHTWQFPTGRFGLEDMFAGHISPAPAGNFIHTKEGWEEVGGYWAFDDGTHEAWGYVLKRLMFGAKFMIMPSGYYLHRYGNDSLFSRGNWAVNCADISNKMIQEYMYIFDDNSRMYVEENRNTWFKNLSNKPLRLLGRGTGKTGQAVR